MRTFSIFFRKACLILLVTLSYGCASSSSSVSSLSVTSSRPPLHEAALISDVNTMQRLLIKGANPNEADNSDFTPIHWAAASQMGRNREMIELLVQHGADPNKALNKAKMVPLQFASTPDAARALIQSGARLDTRDISQSTPLHSATNPEVARILLENGANPNATNAMGLTPLESHKQTLPHFGKEAIYAPARKQYQDTIALLERFQSSGSYLNQSQKNTAWGSTRQEGSAPRSAGMAVIGLEIEEPLYNEHNPNQEGYTDDQYYNDNSTNNAMDPSSYSDTNYGDANAYRVDPYEAEQEAKTLQDNQMCPMFDNNWYYTGNSCKNDTAHGIGTAINPYEQTRFEGMIQSGYPIKGALYQFDEITYEGDFSDGLAHGSGICYFESSPEECKYYKGQRIDTLHKQRQEFQRQQEQRQQEQISQSRRNPSEATYGDRVYSQPEAGFGEQRYDTSYEEPEDAADSLGDAIQDEVIDRGAKYLFDELF